jgi:nitrite reductase/ring-hydroxylating ferredoxin subunit
VHGMKFDVTNGCFAGTPHFGVASFPAKVVDGEIMVALGSTPAAT